MGEHASAILIPWAQTDWQACGRYATSTPISINAHGEEQIQIWSRILEPLDMGTLYGPDNGPGDQTARHLAHILDAKVKRTAALAEVNLGLWEGLSPDELKKRFGKAYRQWRNDPASVCPPEGEGIPDAVERLSTELKRIATRNPRSCSGVVLGPLSFAALRCKMEGQVTASLWEMAFDQPVSYSIDLDEDRAILATDATG